MKLLRFLALFFATLTRRHRQPPTAGNPPPPPPPPTEEELAQAFVESCIAQLEELFRQWKAGTLPPQPAAKPARARRQAPDPEAEPEEAQDSPKPAPIWIAVPPRRPAKPTKTSRRPAPSAIRRTIRLVSPTPTHAHFVTI